MTHHTRTFLVAALVAAPSLWALPAAAGAQPGGFLEQADVNGDGIITRDEVTAFRDATATQMDANKDGFITADEIKTFILAKMTERADKMAAARIKAGDTDGDGRLSVAEAKAATDGKIDKFFARADANGDGALSQTELTALHAKWAHKKAD